MGAVVNSQRIINQILEVEEKGSESNMTDPFDELLEEMKNVREKRPNVREGDKDFWKEYEKVNWKEYMDLYW